MCVPLRTPNQIYPNCISKPLQDTTLRLTACFWNVGQFHRVLYRTKRKPPRCWLANTGPALKKEIKRQIGKGGGESPPVPDSCLDWQKRTCQWDRVSVFSPSSTALTSPAARPEVCVGSTNLQSARNKIYGHQLLKIEQKCLTWDFFSLYSKTPHSFMHPYFIIYCIYYFFPPLEKMFWY